MQKSEQIGELVTALAKAQAEFTFAAKDSTNPAFNSKYADLAANIQAVRPALSKHGIALIQLDESDVERQTASVTTSLHFAEQWISVTAEAPAVGLKGFNVQSIGACWTYLRRYTLQALCGLASDDDDGNSLATQNQPVPKKSQAEVRADAQRRAEEAKGAISHPENAPRPTSTQESTQRATQASASAPAAAQPQAGVCKFIPPNGLTAVIKSVKEIEALPAKPASGDVPAMKAIRGRMVVNFIGAHNGVSEMSCFDTKLFDCLRESVGLECHFQIAEKDSNGKHYINIEDVMWVAGEEYVDGKPVQVQGEQQ